MEDQSKQLKESVSAAAASGMRKDNTHYTANMGEAVAREEYEKQKGKYDEDGFYVLENGSFYDPNGYYFDEEGYDIFGGYYENGEYVPGPEHAEAYYKLFDEYYGQENAEDEYEYDLEDYFSEEDEDYGDEDEVQVQEATPEQEALNERQR